MFQLTANRKIFKITSFSPFEIRGIKMSDEFEDDVYDDSITESPEDSLEDDEITPEEEGFLRGYESDAEESIDEEELDKEFE